MARRPPPQPHKHTGTLRTAGVTVCLSLCRLAPHNRGGRGGGGGGHDATPPPSPGGLHHKPVAQKLQQRTPNTGSVRPIET